MTPADLQTARLENLPKSQQSRLLEGTQAQTLETGQTICLQDEPPEALLILLEGWFKL